MSTPLYARLASKLFVRALATGPAPTADGRARAIAAIAAAIVARRRRRVAGRFAFALAAVAAILAMVFGSSVKHSGPRNGETAAARPVPSAVAPVQIVAHSVGGVASLVLSGTPAPLPEGRSVSDGSRLVTPADGRATLAFSTGTRVIVGEGTDLTLGAEDATQVLRLNRGWIDLHVAKLVSGQRFLVDTADSEVEVRGTRFRVSIVRADPACGGGVRTRVSVTEGVVVVRHGSDEEARITAGGEWPEGCVAGPAAQGAALGRLAVGRPDAVSTLADENNLFSVALSAKRRGDLRGALATLDRLLTKYPTSELVENAHVERMRLLRVTAPARAVSTAKQYIASYPNGFARVEAEALVAGSP